MPGRDTCSITPVGFQWKRWWRIYTVLNLCRNTLKDKFSHYYEDALWSSYFLNKKKNLLVHHVISFIQIVPGSADSQTISWSVVCLVSLFFLLLVLNSDEQPSKVFLAIVKEMRKIEPVPKKILINKSFGVTVKTCLSQYEIVFLFSFLIIFFLIVLQIPKKKHTWFSEALICG